MPLAIRWAERIRPSRVVDDYVNLTDLAPTFLEAAGLGPVAEMTGRSLMPLLVSEQSGKIDPERDFVVTGRERHANVRAGNVGYPTRAIRTEQYLYVKNFRPERWPAGDPPVYGDVDQHTDIARSPRQIRGQVQPRRGFPRHNGRSRWRTDRLRHVRACEPHSFPRQLIQMRSVMLLATVTTEVIYPKIVRKHEYDVRSRLRPETNNWSAK